MAERPPNYSRLSKASIIAPFEDHIRGRLAGCDVSAKRILAEIRAMGYSGRYTVVEDFILPIKQDRAVQAEMRFETRPGE